MGRLLLGLVAFGWVLGTLQPCAMAATRAEHMPDQPAQSAHLVHASHGEHDGATVHHEPMVHPGADSSSTCLDPEQCPVFQAIQDQASDKPAASDPGVRLPAIALPLETLLPLPAPSPSVRLVGAADPPHPLSPLEEFRVLRI